MIRLSTMTLTLIAAALMACHAAPPPTRAELIERLQQCRDTLAKPQPTDRPLSRCASLDPSGLNGIPRHELAAALGPPTICIGLSEGGSPSGADCPRQLNPKWSFHPIGGAGLELFCETDEQQRCEVVRWLRSGY